MAMQQRWRAGEYSQGGWQSNSRTTDSGESGNGQGLAKILGWFSIGLGLMQIANPGGVARMAGLYGDGQTHSVMRACGMRELATGVGLLITPRPAGWVKARVGGDVMDLTLLGAALASGNADRDRLTRAAFAVVGVTIADVLASNHLSSNYDVDRYGGEGGYQTQSSGGWSAVQDARSQPQMRLAGPESQMRDQHSGGIHVKKSITINSSAEELYNFWRHFGNLAPVMSHIEAITEVGERQSHWVVKAPGGMTVEWDAEVTADEPNKMIAWHSLPHADVDNSGVVRFIPAPGGRGTEVQTEFKYNPPAGKLGATIAKIFGEEPEQQVEDDLRRFKQLMEAGEIIVSDATVQGSHLLKQRSAQPPEQLPPGQAALLS